MLSAFWAQGPMGAISNKTLEYLEFAMFPEFSESIVLPEFSDNLIKRCICRLFSHIAEVEQNPELSNFPEFKDFT